MFFWVWACVLVPAIVLVGDVLCLCVWARGACVHRPSVSDLSQSHYI